MLNVDFITDKAAYCDQIRKLASFFLSVNVEMLDIKKVSWQQAQECEQFTWY